jgi:hypothetical protein
VKTALKPPSFDPQADYYEWLNQQARALREMQPLYLDWRELAEELEEMGARERRELISHLRILMAHLLKWSYQSNRRGTSWRRTILLARQEAEAVLADSPSLRPILEDCAAKAYEDARRLAGTEMKLERAAWERLFPPACPWTLDELRNPDYLPKPERRP